MTIPPVVPVPSQSIQITASQQPKKVGNPFFRYLMAVVLIAFSIGYALLSVWEKQAPTTVGAIIILVPLVFGCAAASETTFTFVVTTLKPFVPRFGGKDADK